MEGIGLKLIDDRVAIVRTPPIDRTDSGLLIPEQSQIKRLDGVVCAVGPGLTDSSGKLKTPRAKVGDRVLFQNYMGDEFEWNGQEILVLRDHDILGYFPEESHDNS